MNGMARPLAEVKLRWSMHNCLGTDRSSKKSVTPALRETDASTGHCGHAAALYVERFT